MSNVSNHKKHRIKEKTKKSKPGRPIKDGSNNNSVETNFPGEKKSENLVNKN